MFNHEQKSLPSTSETEIQAIFSAQIFYLYLLYPLDIGDQWLLHLEYSFQLFKQQSFFVVVCLYSRKTT